MRKAVYIISALFILAAFVLMLIPGSAALIYKEGANAGRHEVISYFSTLAFGYGFFMPLVALALSVIWLGRTVIGFAAANVRLPHLVLGVSALFFSATSYSRSGGLANEFAVFVPVLVGVAFGLQLAVSVIQTAEMRKARQK